MNKKNEKKFIQSPIAIICYILAALMLIYACFQGGSTVKQINDYYAIYGMNAKPSEYFTYVLQAMLDPLIHAFTFFIAGYILNAVRKLDPKNYKTAEELVEIEEAKKEAREKKQAAKGEAKIAKSEGKGAKAGFAAASNEDSVRADFSESLEAELKSDARAASGAKKKSGQNRSRNSQNKGGSAKSDNKSNEPKSGGKSSSSKSSSKSGDSKSGTGRKTTSRKPAAKKEDVKEALTEAYNNKVEEAAAKTENIKAEGFSADTVSEE